MRSVVRYLPLQGRPGSARLGVEWRPTMDLLRDLQALDTPPPVIVVSSQPDDRQETVGDDAYEFVSEVDAPEHLPDGCRRLVQESKMAAEP